MIFTKTKNLALCLSALLLHVAAFAQTDSTLKPKQDEVETIVIEDVAAPDIEEEPIQVFNENGKVGLKRTADGEILIEPLYTWIYKMNQDYYRVYNVQKSGLFDIKAKKLVLTAEYEDIRNEKVTINNGKENIFVVQKDKKYGILNSNFEPILKIEYDGCWMSYDPYAIVTKDSLEGVYFFSNKSFKIPLKYKDISKPYNIYGFIGINPKSIDYYNRNGDIVFKKLKSAELYWSKYNSSDRSKLLLSNFSKKLGLYDTKNEKFILPQVYLSVFDNYYGYYIVKKKNKFGIVDDENKTIVEFNYDSIAFLKPHFINRWFFESQRAKFDSISQENMLIAVSKNGKFGLIDRKGKVIVDLKYSQVDHINFFYKLKEDGKYWIVDSKGKKITDQKFDDVGQFMRADTCFRAAVFNDGKMGYINSYGNIINPVNKILKPRGYRNVVEMYQGFVAALKAENDSVLYEFCKNYNPDEYTKEFMQRISFNYRGFPEELSKKAYTVDDIAKESYKVLLNFKNLLKERGELESLQFVKMENNFVGYYLFDYYYTLVTETPGILKSNKETYEYKLGELINVDGYWKSFTRSRRL